MADAGQNVPSLEINRNTSGRVVNQPKGTKAQTADDPEPLLSPKEIAATKKYSSSDEIEIDIAKYQSELENLETHRPWYQMLISLACAIIGFVAVWLYSYFHGSPAPWALCISISLLSGIIPAAVLFTARQARLGSLRTAIEILNVRKRNLTAARNAPLALANAAVPGNPPAGYFDRLVDISVKNLGDYYGLVRLHNDKSFSVSVGAGVVGFFLIAAAIGFAFFTKDNQKLPTAISAGSGVITEFISAIFFYLYNRSVREMRDYFDSLLTVQNILLSLKLVNDTQDEKERVKMVGLMLAYLVGHKNTEAKDLLNRELEDKPEKKGPKPAARATAAGS